MLRKLLTRITKKERILSAERNELFRSTNISKEDDSYVQNRLGSMLQANQLSNEEKFNNILKFARQILNDNYNSKEHPIFDFIRILGRGIQSDYMKYLMYYDYDKYTCDYVEKLNWSAVGFDERECFIGENGNYIMFQDLKKKVDSSKTLNLSKDLILPWPWKHSRLINSVTNIGEGRFRGEWKQDFANHDVEVWLPIGIAWVRGGNHSITAGIIQGGKLIPTDYYDISEVYNHVKCDGKNFIRTRTKLIYDSEILSPVTNVEFAAMFEIGRLLVQRGISFID